jgi:hypothetical protein
MCGAIVLVRSPSSTSKPTDTHSMDAGGSRLAMCCQPGYGSQLSIPVVLTRGEPVLVEYDFYAAQQAHHADFP